MKPDFAAKNEKFIAFVDKTVGQLFDSADGDLAGLLAAGLDAERETLVQEIGENISVRRGRVLNSDQGGISYYLHGENRKASLVSLSGKNDELGKDIAMHVTAINPLVVRSEDVPEDVLAKEREYLHNPGQR